MDDVWLVNRGAVANEHLIYDVNSISRNAAHPLDERLFSIHRVDEGDKLSSCGRIALPSFNQYPVAYQ